MIAFDLFVCRLQQIRRFIEKIRILRAMARENA